MCRRTAQHQWSVIDTHREVIHTLQTPFSQSSSSPSDGEHSATLKERLLTSVMAWFTTNASVYSPTLRPSLISVKQKRRTLVSKQHWSPLISTVWTFEVLLHQCCLQPEWNKKWLQRQNTHLAAWLWVTKKLELELKLCRNVDVTLWFASVCEWYIAYMQYIYSQTFCFKAPTLYASLMKCYQHMAAQIWPGHIKPHQNLR